MDTDAAEGEVSLSVISYGGGVQSTALLVLACQRKIQADAALFANVGDDSEHPATLEYVRNVATPYAAEHGLVVHELRRVKRDGSVETLVRRMSRPGGRSLTIPMRGSDTGAPGPRSCTSDFKIRVIGKWLRRHGASADNPATVMLGISWDEIQRLGNKKTEPYERTVYPLIEMRMHREACKRVIESAGLPVPPKSACYFCPFHRPSAWAKMRRDEPVLFYKAAELEAALNVRQRVNGRDAVYLTRFGRPLDEAVVEEQPGLDFGTGPGETCDEGYCWT
jgi:hypothetical protein